MTANIVVYGATGHTGRMVAERLAAQGARPILAGRSEPRVRELAERLGADYRIADAGRPTSVFGAVRDGEVVISTVGPFVRHGEPAARAAIAAGATYLDSTGEPAFIRRVFEELGGPAARAGAALLPAMGYDFVPGALAGALALEEAGPGAARVDVGYYALGFGAGAVSRGTRASALGVALDGGFAYRDGALREERSARRMRSFAVDGRDRPAISVAGAEHLTLPAAYPGLREVNVYLGWFGPLSRPLQATSAIAEQIGRRAPLRNAIVGAGERLTRLLPSPAPRPGDRQGRSWVVAEAYDAGGAPLAEVHVMGEEPYRFTAGLLAWAARRAAGEGVRGTGALGPLQAFGLEALEAGCREAGIERVR